MKKSLLIITLFFSMIFTQEFTYVGNSKCKMCHNKADKGEQYNKWLNGPHAKAMESLAGEEAKKYSDDHQNDAKCLKCHSTYHSAYADLMYTIKANEVVSCESCNVPDSGYQSM